MRSITALDRTDCYLPLARCEEISGLSRSTLRRALKSDERPLPYIKVGLGDPRHAKVLVRRVDLDAWLSAFRAAPPTRAIVDEIVERARRDA
ncbi:MAG: hypothetical protein AB7N53_07205 [Candidatus Binatia bacterium]